MSRRGNDTYTGAHTVIGPRNKDWFSPPRPGKPKRPNRYTNAHKQFQKMAEEAYERTKGRGRLLKG